MTLLRLENFGARYNENWVIESLSLTLNDGDIGVVLGANGAGKSTLLRALSGLIKVRGSAQLDGVELTGRRPEKIARRGLAHVPEGRGMFSDLSVRDNLLAGAYRRHDPKGVAQDLERWLEFFPILRKRIDQLSGSLSGGEQQMLAVARGLMSRPRVLMLDEPSLGLAPKIVLSLFEQLREINETDKTAMLIVEQNAHVALAVAHWGAVMERGQIIKIADSQTLIRDNSVRLAYLGA